MHLKFSTSSQRGDARKKICARARSAQAILRARAQRARARTNFRPARARSAQKILRARAQKFSCCSKKSNTLLKFEQSLCTKYDINGLKINIVVMYKAFNEFLIPYYTLPTLTNQNSYEIIQHFLRARKKYPSRARKNSCARSRSAQPFLRARSRIFCARARNARARSARARFARAPSPLWFRVQKQIFMGFQFLI